MNKNEYYSDKMTHRFTREDIFYKNCRKKKAELSNRYISDKFTYNSQSWNGAVLKIKDK